MNLLGQIGFSLPDLIWNALLKLHRQWDLEHRDTYNPMVTDKCFAMFSDGSTKWNSLYILQNKLRKMIFKDFPKYCYGVDLALSFLAGSQAQRRQIILPLLPSHSCEQF